jgi:hypothetical protein
MPISQKVSIGTFAAALSTLVWAIAAATFAKDVFDEAALTLLSGATTTIVIFIAGWLVPERPDFNDSQVGQQTPPAPDEV